MVASAGARRPRQLPPRGRVACITGTTRGIGRTAAIALAEAGCDIVQIDRRDPGGTRAEIERLGRRTAHVELDLAEADTAACERAIEEATAAFGRLDILVNSAGVIARGSVLDVSAEDADRVLHVNLGCVLAPRARRGARVRRAGQRRDRQRRLAAVVSGRRARVVVRDRQARRGRRDAGARQRMGAARRARQRDRARLHRHRLHRGAARRREPLPRDPRRGSRPAAGARPRTSPAPSSTSARPPAPT